MRENSVCLLENVCWHGGALEYYYDVEESLRPFVDLPALFAEGLVPTTPIEDKRAIMAGQPRPTRQRYSPVLKTHPRRRAPVSEYDVHVLDFMGFGYNFGHFILEHVLAALQALELYRLSHLADRAQIVALRGCQDYVHIFDHLAGTTTSQITAETNPKPLILNPH